MHLSECEKSFTCSSLGFLVWPAGAGGILASKLQQEI